jgi:oligoendopeptidase F
VRTVTIPARAEIPIKDTWDLSQLFPTEEDYRKTLENVRGRYRHYQDFVGRLSGSPECLVQYLEFHEALGSDLEKLSHYASLKKAENNSEQLTLARWAELRNLGTQISETRSFAVPEIQNLTDDRFTELTQSPLLDPWKIYLERLRRYRPHTLSAGEERLLALAGAAVSGYKEIFSQLTHVDMKFGTLTTNHGEKIGLTLGLADSLLANPDRGTRRRAFHQLYRQIKNYQFTLASALAASVRADVFYARSRRYPSAMAAALFPDNIPFAVYDNLIALSAGIFRSFTNTTRSAVGSSGTNFIITTPLSRSLRRSVSIPGSTKRSISSAPPLRRSG